VGNESVVITLDGLTQLAQGCDQDTASFAVSSSRRRWGALENSKP
jgi:hypothetical protein